MYGESFLVDILSEEDRFCRYVGRDNYFSIARNGDGTFSIRAHDEYTEGGLRLALYREPVGAPIVVTSFAQLPSSFNECDRPPLYQIDVDTSAGDLTIDGWRPDVYIGQLFRVRKISSDKHSVIWNDPTLPGEYRYVQKRGEFMTLMWGGNSFHII
jgi:hypothetical protein